jgi:hypothetical protein
MEHKWIRFSDELPTNIEGGQVDILFGSKGWATYIRGMYTHITDIPLDERLSEYISNIDRFYHWESKMPTHWMMLPEKPKE